MKRNKEFFHKDDPEQVRPVKDRMDKEVVETPTTSWSHNKRGCFQALSVLAFLISWVCNGEMLQGISNGLFGSAYDKPLALTWFSYNYMLLGSCFVYPYVKFHRKWSLSFYIRHVWAGDLGFARAVLACAIIAFNLQILNVLYIVGLECIPMTLANAIYQLQTIFTFGLSVCFLKDKFVLSEAVGILVSLVGVAWIVLPPVLLEDEQEQTATTTTTTTTCVSQSAPMILGSLATLGSTAIGGAYLVAWRVFDEKRNNNSSIPLGRLEGLVDTQMTLATIGFCNLLLGWSMLPLAHWMGLEEFILPGNWWILHWNGMVEYAFDASCAVAIYMTSPVVVAVVSPMTIPLSLAADQLLYSTSSIVKPGVSTIIGAIVLMVGVVLVETKPDLSNHLPCWRRQQTGLDDMQTDEEEARSLVLLQDGAEKKNYNALEFRNLAMYVRSN